ncbi:tetratricopeptide repeat protein [Sphingobacterium faecium]|uniref:tetratricopeptide repeat protein n=1 Tax=Sphingobacterium faecium TaxID=34087 RepID=UPI0024696C02|nr:tetratricopeptide repeat protein [Sphingobacterium faecium]MDH5828290.1 tetratricopeptide repeat protein [Sphingobacterium faecium]
MENKRISEDINLFHQAINNPLTLSESDLLSLIAKFPYAQSLRFAYERHLYLLNKEVHNISSTLLYAANPNWLYEYLHKATPVEPTAEVAFEDDEYIDFEDTTDEEVELVDSGVDAEDGKKELNALIQSGVAHDFFRLEKVEPVLEQESEDVYPITETILPVETIIEKGEEERVSVYDDDLLPYSFLWWLHKTRLEHAETYQPFLKPPIFRPEPVEQDITRFKQTIDSQLLDQQIRENIFHLQSPEVKLSEEFKNTVPFQVEKKNTDHLIERFIKEDPQIKPPPADKINLENKARKSSEDQYSLVTETLARIYIEQGLYPKAIEVYKKLVLKYPEKNAYFASEILNLEKKLT